ncbi:hypothetical protein R3P38DRAFT_3196024 [Favolaschia claudopus]|uniref:F-box domain-containing protein n=1 Tax=Favolaschia claudopus TaxID=2862362 RepID=A0AAW0BAL0_9AGAR
MPSTLPNEVYIEILALAVHMGRTWGEDMAMRGAIALVCRLWRFIVNSDASIWRNVIVRYGMAWKHIAFVLDRAAHMSPPLNILVNTEVYSSGKTIGPCPNEDSLLHWLSSVGPLLAELTPRADRIEVRSFNQPAVRSILTAMEFSTAYAVSDLFFAASSPHDAPTSMPGPGGDSERLDLLGITPYWDATVYDSLVELRLAEITDLFPWPALRMALESCHVLRTLGLTNVACRNTQDGEAISLPHLVVLHFTYTSVAHVAVLRLIITPGVTELRLQSFGRRGWRELFNAVSPLFPSLQQLCLAIWSYSEVAIHVFPRLHNVVCVDIRHTSPKFLEEMREATQRPLMRRLRKWIVPSGITVAQANRLLTWPGEGIEALYEGVPWNKDVDGSRYLRWTKVDWEFRVRGVKSWDD